MCDLRSNVNYHKIKIVFAKWMNNGLIPMMTYSYWSELDYYILDAFGYTPEDTSPESIERAGKQFMNEAGNKFDWLRGENGFALFKAYLARKHKGLEPFAPPTIGENDGI
jgi:hypothetical protein